MLNSDKYIDFHTHSDIIADNTLTIRNIFPENITEIKLDRLYSVGLHPWYIREENLAEQIQQVRNATINPQCIAIGECGLDRAVTIPFDLQTEAFIKQIEIANLAKMPLIIHCVRTYPEMIKIKKEAKTAIPWIIHGFHGNLSIAEQLIKNGFYLSLGAFLRNSQAKMRNLVSAIPLDKLFLETDESDIPINEIYEICAEIIGLNVIELKKVIADNFVRIFGNGK